MSTMVVVSPLVDQWTEFVRTLEDEQQVRVIKVSGGAEAIATVRSEPTTAVIVDQMPDDGTGPLGAIEKKSPALKSLINSQFLPGSGKR